VRELGISKTACIVFVFCAAAAIAVPAQTFTVLATFNGPNGANPNLLVQGTDGNFYGTTDTGGTHDLGNLGAGTAFKITPNGTLTTLYDFCAQANCLDGDNPQGGLLLATDGNFYGTTIHGGIGSVPGGGTVFKITPAGTLTTLYKFCAKTNCADGSFPGAGLVLATNGKLYGTTLAGGAHNLGTVFNITRSGTLTTLHSFNGSAGSSPFAGLVQANDGNFYGTTNGGGTNSRGTVFKISPSGKLTTLYSFCSQTNCTDGSGPLGGLVQARDGNFYGTTLNGGAFFTNGCFPVGCGTVFKITSSGTLTTLHSFRLSDGANPFATLVQATNGNLYGTTSAGGGKAGGTIFEITPSGTLTTLHAFARADGFGPFAGLIQATNGTFYGTNTFGGSTQNDGTVFSLSVGLGPFVETLPTSGKVGEAVIILGTDLTDATSLSFNGSPATFKVVSNSEIKATVPTGATTGTVEVTTPNGTLRSNLVFRVTPQIQSFTPTSGPVGTTVQITGVSLKQSTRVTFGGVKATFTVNSDRQITATVPTGAKTGSIAITTPGGTAVKGIFTVTP
jgi:uncharacterized repeat protein (TIGR03803 family)